MDQLSIDKRLFRKGTALELLLITLLWLLAIAVVNPRGDFPLNDDWSYGLAVQNMLEEGSFSPTPWTSMSLISQVAWGALFTSLFGFSFEVLRFSTLLLALAGLVGIYFTVKEVKPEGALALLVVLILAFNPVFFALSNTFMTDVPFFAFTALALFCFVRYLKAPSLLMLLGGTLMAVLAILCRQVGLFIPLAFGLAVLSTKGWRSKQSLLAFAPLLIGLLVLFLFQQWMNSSGKAPVLYGKQLQQLLNTLGNPATLLKRLFKNLYISVLYVGLFSAPLLLLFMVGRATSPWTQKAKKWLKTGMLPLSLLLAAPLIYKGRLMPVGRNVLHKGGIGPFSLSDTYQLQLPNVQDLPEGLWIFITLLSVLGGAALLIYLLAASLSIPAVSWFRLLNSRSAIMLFFLLGAIIYSAPLLFLPTFFDRYLLIPFVLLVLMISVFNAEWQLNRPRMFTAGIALTASAIFTLALTHDYLSWNRARWQALAYLSGQQQAAAAGIDGGFEFNALQLYKEHPQVLIKNNSHWATDTIDYQYLLSFGQVPGYQVIKKYPYSRWFHSQGQSVLILRRKKGEISVPDSGGSYQKQVLEGGMLQ